MDFLPRRCRLFLACFAFTLACTGIAGAAERVVCHYAYGGAEHVLAAEAVDSPYAVRSVEVGSYFRLRVVFRDRPADLAAVKVYVYADRDEGATPIHQGTWPWPPSVGAGAHGFTGLHAVYEPVRDGELQYWCAAERAS